MAKVPEQVSYEWHPGEVLAKRITKPYACVVLNRKITAPPDVVVSLWENAAIRCTVDGGSNRWRTFITSLENGNKLKLPDFITGDFDSITEETVAFFNDPSIKHVKTPDQDYTDFDKAIQVLRPDMESKNINDVYVLQDTSGRLDHIMANIHILYKTELLNLYLLCGTSMSWLLRSGAHSIKIPKDLADKERWCALLPVGGRAVATSTGLKWDLHDTVLDFTSGIVSSSNTYQSDTVSIRTDSGILWSMGVFNFHDD